MSYHPGDTVSPVRYREDVGLELRCTTCPKGMNWWPLTEEFWGFTKSFKRCLACSRTDKNRRQNRASRTRPEVREANRLYQIEYRKAAKGAKSLYQFDRYWADPEGARQKARDYYQRNREAVLERKRDQYAAKKAA